ncbi:hypothetical protein DFH94DRAFT_680136 [Russula ochroleuca]|jgi:hypothetical protein|uniref:Uncharacterized protein n=1 Tax=Russula ochroleuca TaxID=152965 RepID=A0A9P5N1H4_9AGAM|nr:hypothetical protein DFH94DRAFT_680136 [Russula ochroleuca]
MKKMSKVLTDEPESSEAEEDEHVGTVNSDEKEGALSLNQRFRDKKSRHKSQLDIAALTGQQTAHVALESNQLLHFRLRKRYYTRYYLEADLHSFDRSRLKPEMILHRRLRYWN